MEPKERFPRTPSEKGELEIKDCKLYFEMLYCAAIISLKSCLYHFGGNTMKYKFAVILFVLCASVFSVAQAQEPLELSLQINKMHIEKQIDSKGNDELYQWFVIDANLTNWYPSPYPASCHFLL